MNARAIAQEVITEAEAKAGEVATNDIIQDIGQTELNELADG